MYRVKRERKQASGHSDARVQDQEARGNVISEADYTVRIPMKHNVDSLNVAAAAAVAFWELRKK